ncbi:hypothetical protein [Agrobacterium sp. NPDC090273]|uniref:hypothetical protein n=1 Tax=Agrobacterium sp. NPDC090273 TaxID=3363919 RepID=UPI00383A968F
MNKFFTRRNVENFTVFFLTLAFLMYATRDALSGAMRYYFDLLHIGFVWFLIDITAFIAFIIFAFQQIWVRKNLYGIWVTVCFIFSLAVSLLTTNDTMVGFFSSIKMFAPMFIGLALGGVAVEQKRWVMNFLRFIFIATIIGLLLNPHVDYPWLGQEIEVFGVTREATRLWWVSGGIVRYGGFAGDSTMASYFIVFLFTMLSRHHSLMTNLSCLPFAFWAINTTTSKTAMGVMVVSVALYLLDYCIRNKAISVFLLRSSARLSFLCLLVPPLLMLLVGGMDLGSISGNLLSLQDRINNTWSGPFIVMADMFPVTMFTGCGLGCFTYPMFYTSYGHLMIPLDNFYLVTFLMMGFPILFYFYSMYRSASFSVDISKLQMMTIFNIYAVTVQCYGPSFATLMVGYIFSDIFALRFKEETRGRLAKKVGSFSSRFEKAEVRPT